MFGPLGGIIGYFFTSKLEKFSETSISDGSSPDPSEIKGRETVFL